MKHIDEHLQELRLWHEQCPLKIWRERRGLTQAALAQALGASPSAIYCWESGSRDPSLPFWQTLSQLTGMTLEQWLSWKQQRPTL
jgi:transcriptional regulator with XRE-family HTH domain